MMTYTLLKWWTLHGTSLVTQTLTIYTKEVGSILLKKQVSRPRYHLDLRPLLELIRDMIICHQLGSLHWDQACQATTSLSKLQSLITSVTFTLQAECLALTIRRTMSRMVSLISPRLCTHRSQALNLQETLSCRPSTSSTHSTLLTLRSLSIIKQKLLAPWLTRSKTSWLLGASAKT